MVGGHVGSEEVARAEGEAAGQAGQSAGDSKMRQNVVLGNNKPSYSQSWARRHHFLSFFSHWSLAQKVCSFQTRLLGIIKNLKRQMFVIK